MMMIMYLLIRAAGNYFFILSKVFLKKAFRCCRKLRSVGRVLSDIFRIGIVFPPFCAEFPASFEETSQSFITLCFVQRTILLAQTLPTFWSYSFGVLGSPVATFFGLRLRTPFFFYFCFTKIYNFFF